MTSESRRALDDVAAERRRQVEAEGWSPEHDDLHNERELLYAAHAYYRSATGTALSFSSGPRKGVPLGWPWEETWWKPKSPRYDLVRSGALALAEIERITRLNRRTPLAHDDLLNATAFHTFIIAEIERLDRSPASPA